MRIEGNVIIADEGKNLYRKSDDLCFGKERSLGYTYYIGGERINPPHLELPEDYYEMTREETESKRQEYYLSLVEPFIRERYSLSQELAIQRQRDSKPNAFQEYFSFCEECKTVARQRAAAKYPDIEDLSK